MSHTISASSNLSYPIHQPATTESDQKEIEDGVLILDTSTHIPVPAFLEQPHLTQVEDSIYTDEDSGELRYSQFRDGDGNIHPRYSVLEVIRIVNSFSQAAKGKSYNPTIHKHYEFLGCVYLNNSERAIELLKKDPKVLRARDTERRLGYVDRIATGSFLHIGVGKKSTKTMRAILDASELSEITRFIDTPEMEDRTVDQNTALMLAAKSGSAESVKLLLEHGADVSAFGWKGRTAMHMIFHSNILTTEPLRLLLNKAAEKHTKEVPKFVAAVINPAGLVALVSSYLPPYCPDAVNFIVSDEGIRFNSDSGSVLSTAISLRRSFFMDDEVRLKAIWMLLEAGGKYTLPSGIKKTKSDSMEYAAVFDDFSRRCLKLVQSYIVSHPNS